MSSQASNKVTKYTTRDACDKCHQLKTRCEKASDCDRCQRCVRLNLNCVYSPSLPFGRPRGSRTIRHGSNSQKQGRENDASSSSIGQASSQGENRSASASPLGSVPSPDLLVRSSDQSTEHDSDDHAAVGHDFMSAFEVDGSLSLTATWPQEADSEFPPLESFDMDFCNMIAPADFSGSTPDTSNDPSRENSASACFHKASKERVPDFKAPARGTEDWLSLVLGLEVEALKLYRSLILVLEHDDWSLVQADGFNAEYSLSHAIENTYTATQTFVDLARRVFEMTDAGITHCATEDLSQFLMLGAPTPRTTTSTSQSAPHTASLLLLASTYVRLTHVFEMLLRIMVRSFKSRSRSASYGQQSPTSATSSSGRIPMFRMADSNSFMPSAASLGMHFVAVQSMVRMLRRTMTICATRDARAAAMTEFGMESGGPIMNERNPAVILADLTRTEVGNREHSLTQALQLAKTAAGI